ncbi:hypothetical protein [Confluentibacter lentus]|uniref:hypothetical protein n=1 Tax=Confluentibacter lentus TaxID=1699412 RepID=UPI000C28AAB5|nr:hypothetical protein [Confluentibacter lentus]
MNFARINNKILISSIAYSLLIFLISSILNCSAEANYSNEKVKEKLIAQKWIRDSYTSKNSNGNFENYGTKLQLEFLYNGNLLIKESNSTDSDGSGTLPPPKGLVDTLLIYGKWIYYENTNRLTLKVDDSMSHKSAYNYINWRLSNIDNFQFEIENTETNDSIGIIKVNFKSKF